MRQKVVWFVLGVLVGSLFLASAYPTGNNVQYVPPIIQRISSKDYTTLLLYTPNGLPLDVKNVQKAVQEFVLKSAPNAKWHVYAAPELPKGSVITGYGIKVTRDGRVDILITATNMNNPILPDRIRGELLEWSKKAPKFKPDVIPKEKIGVPKGWKVKTVDSNGNVKVYSGESSPYWHNFGKVEIRKVDPPYGNLYARFYMYGLWNDGDPNWETFLAGPGDGAVYRIDPGYGLRESGNGNYGYFVTYQAKIIHDWNLDSKLNPHLEIVKPVIEDGMFKGHSQVSVTISGTPSLTFTTTIPDYEMDPVADMDLQRAVWLMKFNTNSRDAKYSFGTMVASSAKVKEAVLHDGNWHKIVYVSMWTKFEGCVPASICVYPETSSGVVWYVKVG
ncbi:hypothetical protein [Thermococcus sp.]|uniref:hypothetical protein n=1 Tax=Thermococcus sp. TaxID=35749 RepID=UPI0025FAB527|nr:hypothetical protein [Thermococcus sp.]